MRRYDATMTAAESTAVSRLAPSPTGALHVGNARTFLLNWLLARQGGWRLLMRIEDIDSPRVKADAAQGLLGDLRWLGLDWDGPVVFQSQRLGRYAAALGRLLASGSAYACTCTRREVELAASAPHAEDGAAVYPGTCRGRYRDAAEAQRQSGRAPAFRFAAPAGAVEVVDHIAGTRVYQPMEQLGDFVVAKADGTPAYQLAVVVDDAEMGVSEVVRGDDLLESTPRQMLVYRALGLGDRIPAYWHVPLVVGPDGRRLAKRHGDTRLSTLRACGADPRRLVAQLARSAGIETGESAWPAELVGRFDPALLPRRAVVYDGGADGFVESE